MSVGAVKRTAMDDQVLALIRDKDPDMLGTGDIGAHLGAYVLHQNRCGHPDVCRRPEHWYSLSLAVHPGYLVLSSCRRLERGGLVELVDVGRGKLNSNGQYYWRYTGPDE